MKKVWQKLSGISRLMLANSLMSLLILLSYLPLFLLCDEQKLKVVIVYFVITVISLIVSAFARIVIFAVAEVVGFIITLIAALVALSAFISPNMTYADYLARHLIGDLGWLYCLGGIICLLLVGIFIFLLVFVHVVGDKEKEKLGVWKVFLVNFVYHLIVFGGITVFPPYGAISVLSVVLFLDIIIFLKGWLSKINFLEEHIF